MKVLIRNIYTWLILGALVCVVLLGAVAMDQAENDRDKRTEEGGHSFLTFTPSTIIQVYLDDWRIRPRKISGELSLPPGDGPFPAVIIYHGHFHVEDLEPWVRQVVGHLVESGFATFVIDSFTGRKITNTAYYEPRLSRAARLTDVFMALNWLARLDEIDEERIGITGYSVGGTTAMLAANLRLNETSLAKGRSFAAILPVYPSCQARFRNPELINSPMLVLLPGEDDYSPVRFCDEHVEELSGAGFDVRMEKYEEAKHGWINEKASTDCEDCMTFRDCGVMHIEENGHESALDGRVTTLFGWREYLETVYRECGTIGVIFRSNAEMSKETLKATVSFFEDTLQ